MLLNEIIDTKHREMATDKPLNIKSRYATEKRGTETLGAGGYSYVKHNPNTPFEVNKRNHKGIKHDAYNDYIQALMDAKMMGANPYAPIVYGRAKVSGRNTYYPDQMVNAHSYKMERLFSFGELHSEYKNLSELIGVWLDRLEIKYDEKSGADERHEELAIYFNNAIDGLVPVKDKKLMQLIDLIKNLNAFNDMHLNNLLYRKTPYGIQPVLADPVCS